MDKRVVLAKKVDHIDIEVRPTWIKEQCDSVAQRIDNDHNIQVRLCGKEMKCLLIPKLPYQ